MNHTNAAAAAAAAATGYIGAADETDVVADFVAVTTPTPAATCAGADFVADAGLEVSVDTAAVAAAVASAAAEVDDHAAATVYVPAPAHATRVVVDACWATVEHMGDADPSVASTAVAVCWQALAPPIRKWGFVPVPDHHLGI